MMAHHHPIYLVLMISIWLNLACGDDTTAPQDASPDVSPANDAMETMDGRADALPMVPARPTLSSPRDAVDHDPAPDVVHIRLTAAPYRFEVGGETVMGFAYNGMVPGPTIRAKRGDRVVIDVQNELDMPTTIHWHGLHVPFEMDGVVWMGAPIAVGESFRYEFVVDQEAGTYWYHPHFDTRRQVDLGLYGAFILEDESEPAPDEELIVFFDSWGEDPGSTGHTGHRDGTRLTWTANGLVDPERLAQGGETLRLRLVNASNAGYVQLDSASLRLIAGGQGLLAGARFDDTTLLAPGDRRDFEISVGEESIDLRRLPYSIHGGAGRGATSRLFSIRPETPQSPPSHLTWPFSERSPTPDPGYTDIVYVFQGDTDLERWFINGERFPDITIEELAFGSIAIIEIRNASPTEHPFHLHGHGFEVLSINGVPVSTYTFDDTYNIPIRARVRLRLHANNPGDWMTHCHILPHADEGMMTVLRVLPPDTDD